VESIQLIDRNTLKGDLTFVSSNGTTHG